MEVDIEVGVTETLAKQCSTCTTPAPVTTFSAASSEARDTALTRWATTHHHERQQALPLFCTEGVGGHV